MVSTTNGYYEFPEPVPLELKLKDLLENNVDEKYFISEKALEFYNKNNEKQAEKGKLCDEFIEKGLVEENDVIRHSYTNSRMNKWAERNIETNNLSPILDTRPDTLGVVVRKGGLFDKEGQTHQAGSIYDPEGVSPTIDCAGGGYRMPIVEVEDENIRD